MLSANSVYGMDIENREYQVLRRDVRRLESIRNTMLSLDGIYFFNVSPSHPKLIGFDSVSISPQIQFGSALELDQVMAFVTFSLPTRLLASALHATNPQDFPRST